MKELSTDDLISYLRDLGYEDIYRPQRQQAPDVPARRPPAAGPETKAGEGGGVSTPSREAGFLRPEVDQSGSVKTETSDAKERRQRLRVLQEEASGCTVCALAEKRNKVVFGSGAPDADLMFIGEGPGANEDRQGLPFVGRAGELLTRIIQAIDLDREQVYIANVVKCRPPGNRDPRPEEVAACIGFLRQQIALVQPGLLVALGRVAAQTLLACSTPIGRLRGEWHDFEGVPLRVTYHPAALLRNPSLKRPTWEDMQAVRDRLLAYQGSTSDL